MPVLLSILVIAAVLSVHFAAGNVPPVVTNQNDDGENKDNSDEEEAEEEDEGTIAAANAPLTAATAHRGPSLPSVVDSTGGSADADSDSDHLDDPLPAQPPPPRVAASPAPPAFQGGGPGPSLCCSQHGSSSPPAGGHGWTRPRARCTTGTRSPVCPPPRCDCGSSHLFPSMVHAVNAFILSLQCFAMRVAQHCGYLVSMS